MPRYKLTLEYDGTPFLGWQMQPLGPSVQGRLVDAVEKLCGVRPEVRGAGRTDAGVHALGQVAHVDLPKAYKPYVIREAINYHVRPDPIAVLDVVEVPETFDARFSAIKRHYLFRILARRAPPAIDKFRVWWVPQALDAERMKAAAPQLVGRHDFTTFRAAGCQAKSPVKTLERFDVSVVGEEIHVNASAQSFMHHQMRSMVGSLKLVGEGKWTAEDLKAALDARDRSRCGPVTPPSGLYLTKVDYPDGAF
ncbi:MAG TPA: tRNA pseudouridine(38-40) synthase TruA [Hyphomicrobiaceae bacterium]|nr:tRNA pseudouridine(38-40) synthase TruA [Hyphomicrobiaceae bacterium]